MDQDQLVSDSDESESEMLSVEELILLSGLKQSNDNKVVVLSDDKKQNSDSQHHYYNIDIDKAEIFINNEVSNEINHFEADTSCVNVNNCFGDVNNGIDETEPGNNFEYVIEETVRTGGCYEDPIVENVSANTVTFNNKTGIFEVYAIAETVETTCHANPTDETVETTCQENPTDETVNNCENPIIGEVVLIGRDTGIASEIEVSTTSKKQTREKIAKPKSWARKKSQIARMKGEKYLGFRREDPKSSSTIVQDVEPRVIGPPCSYQNSLCSHYH